MARPRLTRRRELIEEGLDVAPLPPDLEGVKLTSRQSMMSSPGEPRPAAREGDPTF